MLRRILYLALVFACIAAAASVIWRFNTFVYKKALREAPPAVRQVIRKVVEVPLRYKIDLVKWFPFSEANALREWEEKVFKGRVVYVVEADKRFVADEKDLPYVRAESKGAASALYYKVRLDTASKHPVISWKWRVNIFPAKKEPESIESERELDFAARVYVIVPVGFVTNWKVIEYVWAEKLAAGTTGTSPYSKNIKVMVLESGMPASQEWRVEERDIVADYTKLFGDPPGRPVGAIAFMTNAEHTGTSADALYDEIRIGYAEDGPAKTGGEPRAN